MVIEISVALIALAFIILVVYLIVVTKALRATLEQANQTLEEARKQLVEIGFQSQKAIENMNQVSCDLKGKVEAFNPIFNAINQAGQILENKATSIKNDFISSNQEENFFSSLDSSDDFEKKRRSSGQRFAMIAAVLELAGIGINLWQKLKKRG
ncbi:MAG: DUF948 domain-containing protein [Parachlamydiaceae bacterium]